MTYYSYPKSADGIVCEEPIGVSGWALNGDLYATKTANGLVGPYYDYFVLYGYSKCANQSQYVLNITESRSAYNTTYILTCSPKTVPA